eukprot:Blabericola_migrator_1__2016@NODE_154_length_12740_cov_225_658329_g135_i0_p2_GENE_NODE_154_length_12740_cov_225_658329_g135_i0NODE_154_length_12740_cov_225_658329_g135_i0_p2_ORF_typecomplete_len671_score71_29Pkinase/PF00069_25/1_3e49Pkinase_Tyr/PF07714_17/1_1e28Kdo/PF06293_14/2_8e13Kinaselike/PF14531_6/2_7e09WaaY/PF06176_11/7_7e07Pkinase_fungal/PF17667_1/2_3e06RIO1/PF01163_22/2_9e05APH/PF01636_23/0_0016APH/PF01636_23/7_1e02YrbLPhoP_reg/PF10707_9/0_0067Choline_kinase/PF01633_20/5_3e03Choline_kina
MPMRIGSRVIGRSRSRSRRRDQTLQSSESRGPQIPVPDSTLQSNGYQDNSDNSNRRIGHTLSLRNRGRRSSSSRHRQQSEEGSVSARKRNWPRGWKQKSDPTEASDSEGGQSTHRGKHLKFWKGRRQTPTATSNPPHDDRYLAPYVSTDTPSTRHPDSPPTMSPYAPLYTRDKQVDAGGASLDTMNNATPLSLKSSSPVPVSYDSRPCLTSVGHDSSTAPPPTTEDNFETPPSRYAQFETPPGTRYAPQSEQQQNHYSRESQFGSEVAHRGTTDRSGKRPEGPTRVFPRPQISSLGTPVDLAAWFYPKAWVADRYRAISTLAPAIHGEVRYVLDTVEKKGVVVKVIHNAAVRPRLHGELENPLVEIGAMTYLYSREARYPVDLVTKLRGVFQDAHFTYLVTEYCSGGELFRLVVERKCFTESFVKAIALQLALALLSLHKNGICHRDVSLENTLLKQDKTVRLIDFGQAEAIYDVHGRERMMSGSAGKDYYRAPEMFQREYRGPPVDVFALGVEIFIMAIGSPPWAEASQNDPRYRAVTQRPDALDVSLRKWGKRDRVSDAFVDLLAAIFCSSPAKRPTIEEMLLHPWFAHDATVWRWVHNKGHSVTVKAQAERLDAYLRTHQARFYFQQNGSRYTGRQHEEGGAILSNIESRNRRDDDRSATRHRRPYA